MGGGVFAGVSELGYKARQRGQVKGLGSERGEGNGACGYALSGLGNFFGNSQGAALTSIHIFLARDAMAIRVHKDELIGARMLVVIEPDLVGS